MQVIKEIDIYLPCFNSIFYFNVGLHCLVFKHYKKNFGNKCLCFSQSPCKGPIMVKFNFSLQYKLYGHFSFVTLGKCTSLVVWFLVHVSGISNGDDSEGSKAYIELEPVFDMPPGAPPPEDNNVMALDGNSLTSKQVVPSGTLDQPVW